MKKYILNKLGQPVEEPDLYKWARWMQDADVHVKDEQIGSSRISTVFLGLDYRYDENGPPLLWETKIFGGPLNQYQARCSGSREQAEAMHLEAVNKVKQQQTK